MQDSATDTFKLRILIIEDSLPHVEMLKHMIDRLGYEHEITHFLSGNEALKHLENSLKNSKQLPNLMIIDLKLNNENGLEILKKIKSHPLLKAIPAILNSSYAEASDIR